MCRRTETSKTCEKVALGGPKFETPALKNDFGKSYSDIGAGKMGPVKQVNQSVEAGQFTACQLLSFHHGARFHVVQVINGCDHPQT